MIKTKNSSQHTTPHTEGTTRAYTIARRCRVSARTPRHLVLEIIALRKKNTLYFYNVLLVPNLTKNLLLISQLPTRFLVNYKLSNVDYYIKEQKTG